MNKNVNVDIDKVLPLQEGCQTLRENSQTSLLQTVVTKAEKMNGYRDKPKGLQVKDFTCIVLLTNVFCKGKIFVRLLETKRNF